MRGVLLLVGLVGCVKPSVVACEYGEVCGAGLICEPIHQVCVPAGALAACDSAQDGETCTFSGGSGVCDQGVCLEVVCGDGVKLGLEECDGDNLGAADSCMDVGYYEDGPIKCTTSCQYDVSACTRRCGDGIKDPEELCDTTIDADQDSCDENGFYRPGPVTCSATCVPLLAACVMSAGYCGDSVLDVEEECEPGGVPPAATCIDGGYDGGGTGCTAFCTPDYSTCKSIGWRRVIPPLQTTFNDVVVASPGSLMLASPGGLVTVANKVVATPFSDEVLNGLWGTPTQLWMVGESGYLGRFDGIATTTLIMPNAGSTSLNAVWASSPTNIYAVGDGRILHDDDGTNVWVDESPAPPPGDPPFEYTGVWGSQSGEVYVVGSGSASYTARRYTAATGWQTENLPLAIGIRILSDVFGVGSTVFAVGESGTIMRRDSGTWRIEPFTSTRLLHGVWARSPNEVFVVGDAGTIGYHDGTWWELDTGLVSDLRGIDGVGTDVYAVGSFGGVFKDSHASWAFDVPRESNTGRLSTAWTTSADRTYVLARNALLVKGSATFSQVAGSPDIQDGGNGTSGAVAMWQGGDRIAIVAFTNSTTMPITPTAHVHLFDGTSWTDRPFASGSRFDAVAATGFGNLFVGGRGGGEIQRWNGTAWMQEAPPVPGREVLGLAAIGSEALAVGSAAAATPIGEIRRRTSTGSWSAMTLPANTRVLRGVWAASETDVFAVGDAGTILHFDGTAWTRMASPINASLTAVSGTSGSDVFAVGEAGTILHYDGARWTQVRVPTASDTSTFHGLSVRPGLVLFIDSAAGRINALVRTGAW